MLDIELGYPSGKNVIVTSRDISEGGLFLNMENDLPVLGEVVSVRLIGDSVGREIFPSDEAVVVHKEADGIGIAFIEMELDDEH